MVLRQLGIRLRGEGRPPELRAESLAVDLVHQTPHIGVAVRELGFQEAPVAVGRLPAVIHCHPGEAELLDHGQRAQHLAGRERPAITPGAPDRLECGCGRRLELHTLRLHHLAVRAQRLKMVALVNRGKAAESFERVPRLDDLVGPEAQPESGVFRVRHRHRQGNQLGGHLDMPHGKAGVAPPHVHHRGSAAVIGGVHAEVIFLLEIHLQRDHPIGTPLIRAALVRPEGRRGVAFPGGDRIPVVRPAGHPHLGVSLVRVAHLEESHLRKAVVHRDHDGLLHGTSSPGEGGLSADPERTAHALLPAAVPCEIRNLGTVDGNRLRRGERAENDLPAVEPRNDMAVHAVVEFQPDIPGFDFHQIAGGAQGAPRPRREDGGAQDGHFEGKSLFHRVFS